MTYERLRLCPPDLTPRGQAHEILTIVAAKHGFTVDELRDHVRRKDLDAARHEAAYEVHLRVPAMTLEKIGALVNRDRSSVWNSIRVCRAAAKSDEPDLFAKAA